MSKYSFDQLRIPFIPVTTMLRDHLVKYVIAKDKLDVESMKHYNVNET